MQKAKHAKTKKARAASYLFAFLLAMGCLSAACLLLSFLTHVQRSAPVPLLSSLFFLIQHVGACGVAAAAVFTGETLPQKCPFRTSEGRIVPCRVGVRVKRRERLEGLY